MQFTASSKRFWIFVNFSSYQSREILAQWGENHKYCVSVEVFKVGQRLNTLSTSVPLPVTEGLQSGCPFLLVPTSYSPGIHQTLVEIKSQIGSCLMSYLCP